MSSKINNEEFYSRFKEQLVTSQKWPGEYIFKFIIKLSIVEIESVKLFFKDRDYELSIKNSSKNNYKSLSIKTWEESPEDVIIIYKLASEIKGIIAL